MHPLEFKGTLYGFDDIWSKFVATINAGMLHHAYILCGQEGIGKATFSCVLANAILNEFNIRSNPLSGSLHFNSLSEQQKANSATKYYNVIKTLHHPDFAFISNEYECNSLQKKENGNSISIKEIRYAKTLLNKTHLLSKWYVLVIDNIDCVSPDAANAMLKLLEEPNLNTCIICTTSKPKLLLETIKSRCCIVKVPNLSYDNFCNILRPYTSHNEDIEKIYRISSGNVKIATQIINLELLKLVNDLYSIFVNNNVSATSKIIKSELIKEHFDIIKRIILFVLCDVIKTTGKFLHSYKEIFNLLYSVNNYHLDKNAALAAAISYLN